MSKYIDVLTVCNAVCIYCVISINKQITADIMLINVAYINRYILFKNLPRFEISVSSSNRSNKKPIC